MVSKYLGNKKQKTNQPNQIINYKRNSIYKNIWQLHKTKIVILIILIIIISIVIVVILIKYKTKNQHRLIPYSTTPIQTTTTLPITTTTTLPITTTTTKPIITTPQIISIYELILPKMYQYDGIQNIQLSEYNPMVYLININDTLYFDVKFSKIGKYYISAQINFISNQEVELETGIIYPGYNQYPKKPISKKISNPKPKGINLEYQLIGEITLLENENLSQPLFIRNKGYLNQYITVNNIKVQGDYPINFVYTEWWDKEKNTGKRPFQHANHIVSNSIFDNIKKNIRHVYKEMIILKSHIHTYATAINGPDTYMGIDFTDGRIIFSVWNPVINGVEKKNDIIYSGKNVESNMFNHEGNGSYFTLRYNKYYEPLAYNYKYGFYNFYKDLGDKTEYSGYFINLGPEDKPYDNPEWILIGKVIYYKSFININRIGGFLENYLTANGHLYQRSYVMGNAWASVNGINWYPSTHEEAVLDDLTNQQAFTYGNSNNGLIKYNIGGRLGMKDIGLKKHDKLRSYDIYRKVKSSEVPKHILSLVKTLL